MAERIEKDLILLGSTAVEDKLQHGVSRVSFKKEPSVHWTYMKQSFKISNDFSFGRFQNALTNLPRLE